jgi:hypothetical protein
MCMRINYQNDLRQVNSQFWGRIFGLFIQSGRNPERLNPSNLLQRLPFRNGAYYVRICFRGCLLSAHSYRE